jgi:hypothetical protein
MKVDVGGAPDALGGALSTLYGFEFIVDYGDEQGAVLV